MSKETTIDARTITNQHGTEREVSILTFELLNNASVGEQYATEAVNQILDKVYGFYGPDDDRPDGPVATVEEQDAVLLRAAFRSWQKLRAIRMELQNFGD